MGWRMLGRAWLRGDSGVPLCLAPISSALALRGYQPAQRRSWLVQCPHTGVVRERLHPHLPSRPAFTCCTPSLALPVHLLGSQVASEKTGSKPQQLEFCLCHSVVCAIFPWVPHRCFFKTGPLPCWIMGQQRYHVISSGFSDNSCCYPWP